LNSYSNYDYIAVTAAASIQYFNGEHVAAAAAAAVVTFAAYSA